MNCRPPACKADALPAELRPLKFRALVLLKARNESRVTLILLIGDEGQTDRLFCPSRPTIKQKSLGTALSLRESWWAQKDSNLRPQSYQGCALTN